jgi:hypothetical protein
MRSFITFYSSPNIIRMIKSWRMRWAEHVARMGEKRNEYKILVGKPEGKRPLGRPFRHTNSLAGPWSMSLKSVPKGLSSKR